MEEYAEHFDMKLRDGYSEEEIAARLAPPAEIAAQFGEIKLAGGGKTGNKIILAIGLFFADILAWPFIIMLKTISSLKQEAKPSTLISFISLKPALLISLTISSPV